MNISYAISGYLHEKLPMIEGKRLRTGWPTGLEYSVTCTQGLLDSGDVLYVSSGRWYLTTAYVVKEDYHANYYNGSSWKDIEGKEGDLLVYKTDLTDTWYRFIPFLATDLSSFLEGLPPMPDEGYHHKAELTHRLQEMEQERRIYRKSREKRHALFFC